MGTQTYEEQSTAPRGNPPAIGDAHSGAQQAAPRKHGLRHRGWRKITYGMIAWTTVMVLIAGSTAATASHQVATSCPQGYGLGSYCQGVASQVGANQFEHDMKIWLAGFVVLSIIWFMTRPQARPAA
jgi:hypothetical protein